MKDGATILRVRQGKTLLVASARSRRTLPGGIVRRAESPQQAARRELEEEMTLQVTDFMYPFQFGAATIATLSTSAPTRGIVELFCGEGWGREMACRRAPTQAHRFDVNPLRDRSGEKLRIPTND